MIDARGNATTSYYNADNEVVLTVDAKGFASARSYDANGNVVSETLFMTPLALPVNPAVRPTPTASARDQTTTFELRQAQPPDASAPMRSAACRKSPTTPSATG